MVGYRVSLREYTKCSYSQKDRPDLLFDHATVSVGRGQGACTPGGGPNAERGCGNFLATQSVQKYVSSVEPGLGMKG